MLSHIFGGAQLPEVRFFVVCSTLSFCSYIEHSQYRVSAVDVSPDFIRPELTGNKNEGRRERHGSNIRLTEIKQNSRESQCSKYKSTSPSLKRTLNNECLQSA